jgi:N-acetylmuramoyl-L-alanine amidase
MSDNPTQRGDEQDPQEENDQLPASVIFMEMMRQAAARQRPSDSDRPPLDSDDIIEAETIPLNAQQVAARSSARQAAARQEAARRDAEPMTPPPPMTPEERAHDAALEAQRVRRVQRRKERKRRQTVGVMGGFFRTALVVIFAAGLLATIFTWFTSADYLRREVRTGLEVAMATSASTLPATSLPTPNWFQRIGIVSGHRGPENDPGAVCIGADGQAVHPTENEINFSVAQIVVRELRAQGYSVDLLDEFDPRLQDYQAAALVSIHSNTCQDWDGEIVSGFLVASAASRAGMGGRDEVLVDCVAQQYGQTTGLERRLGVTIDMTDYHSFREIHPLTPAAIIELGFLQDDRATLTERQPEMAQGIVDGILCFMSGENPIPTPESLTPFPLAETTQAAQ